jgi:hypothetical protein
LHIRVDEAVVVQLIEAPGDPGIGGINLVEVDQREAGNIHTHEGNKKSFLVH